VKRVFISSLAGAAASVLVLLALSAMTIVPWREAWRARLMVLVGGFLAAWVILAVVAFRRRRGPGPSSPGLERLAAILVVAQAVLVLLLAGG